MLTRRHLAIARAALQFWEEEICPHGDEGARGYLHPRFLPAPSAAEVRELAERFLPTTVRYAICADAGRSLASPRLFRDMESARRQLVAGQRIAVVLLPPDPAL